MHNKNTPPRSDNSLEDDDFAEEIILEDDQPPEDSDDELEEITMEELEERFGIASNNQIPEEDDAKFSFEHHTAAVFGCAMYAPFDLAVTGGEDDVVYLWNRKTGEIYYKITEHKDTVTEVRFSHDGSYLATGDLAGDLKVYKVLSEDGKYTLHKVWEFSMGDMTWMCWHFGAHVLIAGTDAGEIYVWRIPSGDCKILPGTGVRCEAGELTCDGKRLFTAYADGALKLWDLKTNSVVMDVDDKHPMAHERPVTAVACDKESPLYMSGGEDSKILFCSNNGPVGAIETDGHIECLDFSPAVDIKMAASGTLNGQVAIWDFINYALRVECERQDDDNGISKLKWIDDNTVVVGTFNGSIYGFDARTGKLKFRLNGHAAHVYDFQYDPTEHLLLSVSEDQTAKIFVIPDLH